MGGVSLSLSVVVVGFFAWGGGGGILACSFVSLLFIGTTKDDEI